MLRKSLLIDWLNKKEKTKKRHQHFLCFTFLQGFELVPNGSFESLKKGLRLRLLSDFGFLNGRRIHLDKFSSSYVFPWRWWQSRSSFVFFLVFFVFVIRRIVTRRETSAIYFYYYHHLLKFSILSKIKSKVILRYSSDYCENRFYQDYIIFLSSLALPLPDYLFKT